METRRVKRKNFKIGLMLAVIASVTGSGLVWFWKGHAMIDLWLTPDQQGRYYFDKGDLEAAGTHFQDPLWKGVVYYKTKNFEAAMGQFARVETPEGYFNLGDTYARLGQLDQAVASYEEALRRKPEYTEARENRDLIRSLIEKKKSEKEEEEAPDGKEPTYKPDEYKFDEKGNRGKKGEIDQAELSAEQIQQVWLKRLQTTPSDFLRFKFAVQAEESKSRSGSRRERE